MITDEMVEKACVAYWGDKNMTSMFKGKTREGVSKSMRAALEAALSAQVQDVAEGWSIISNHGSVLIYCLKQNGWRKGEPVMVNDVTIRIENAVGSNHDLTGIADAIIRSLSTAPAKD